jgi:hypothetical protein
MSRSAKSVCISAFSRQDTGRLAVASVDNEPNRFHRQLLLDAIARGFQMSGMEHTALLGTAIVASLPMVAVVHFLSFGWKTRRDQIVFRFTNDSIGDYKKMFCPSSDFKDWSGFTRYYDSRFGRRLFVLPVLVLFTTVIFLSYLCVSWVFSHDWFNSPLNTATIAISALAGAYVWITYDLILRARQNDVVTSDVNRATLRLLISLPFGFAISAFAGDLSGTTVKINAAALAFFVGAFPTDSLLKFMRRTAGGVLKLDTSADANNVPQLLKINGISVPIAERFIDEGVNTILQLAYADPITLTIRSAMDFSFILDCSGQALVAIYFDDDQMKIVRKYGLRSSIEVLDLSKQLVEDDKIASAAAEQGKQVNNTPAQTQLKALADELKLDVASTRFIIDQIAGDPYTEFAWKVWEPADEAPGPVPTNSAVPGIEAAGAEITRMPS